MANTKKPYDCSKEQAEIKKILEELNRSKPSHEQTIDAFKRIGEIQKRITKRERAKEENKQRELREKEAQRKAQEAFEAKKKEEAEKLKKEQHIKSVTSMELPLDWNNVFSNDPRTKDVYVESISDALILSLTTLAKVDIEYISAITGESCKTVICALKGSIYQNPETWKQCDKKFYKGWETAEEYLSGNLIQKLKVATEENEKYNGYFQDNIDAIMAVLPKTVSAKEIYVTLGSPWVPTDVIDDFITHILKIKNGKYSGTLHDEITGTWDIPKKGNYHLSYPTPSRSTYGTPRMMALDILESTLNMKNVVVTDTVSTTTTKSGKKQVINREDTIMALEKQDELINEFKKWIWRDPARKERLEDIFDSKFACIRRRIFNGAFLDFPTLSSNIQLFPYQKNAIARILFSPNTLLAHDVGSGKTYIMIAAGMELRRMGLSKKNLYVVPNSLLGQWRTIFKDMYPSANVLCVEPKHFTKHNKNETLKKIRDNDYDGIIMPYSSFDSIPLSHKYYIEELEEARAKIVKLENEKGKGKITSGLRRKKESIDNALIELSEKIDEIENAIYFDELEINRLFVDEAHNYKNVAVETKTERVLGISPTGSKKCRNMMDKVHHVQKENNGGGVVMATGTPITNSITDAFVMQKYLQSGELAMLDLQNFDSWIGMFAERVTEFEIDVDTTSYRLATRFAKFHNLPELTTLLSSIADFHQVDPSAGVPEFSGYDDALIAQTPTFQKYLKEISARAEIVRAGKINRKDDNMLKITTDGRKAALDIRLVEPKAPLSYNSKVVRCAEKVTEIYRATTPQKSVQLVFCDSSTPKPEFNIYSELKRLLISYGIPEREIAFIHDASSEKQRKQLFAKTISGDIRILLGSTFKLGLGVNVQDKLIALHHLDIPWRPADMTQREGRILRQGNQNPEIFIYRYITEGSFDSYSWQLLETKQRFISGLLSGSITERSGTDIDDTVLNYAEVKALAVGNPLVKDRVETANELSRYLSLQKKAIENHIRLEKEKREMPALISNQERVIRNCEADIELYKNTHRKLDKDARKLIREKIFNAVRENVLMQNEETLMSYQGFNVILPTNMSEDKPFLWLQANGKYRVELSMDSDVGMLIRIDNKLEKLDEHLANLQKTLENYKEREHALGEELTRKHDYTDKIEEYRKKLNKIDKELGVNKS